MKKRKLALGLTMAVALILPAAPAAAKDRGDDRTEQEDHSEDYADDSTEKPEDHADGHVEDHAEKAEDHADDSTEKPQESRDESRGRGSSPSRGQEATYQAAVKQWETRRKNVETLAKKDVNEAKEAYKEALEEADTKAERVSAAKQYRAEIKRVETEKREALKKLGPKPKQVEKPKAPVSKGKSSRTKTSRSGGK